MTNPAFISCSFLLSPVRYNTYLFGLESFGEGKCKRQKLPPQVSRVWWF